MIGIRLLPQCCNQPAMGLDRGVAALSDPSFLKCSKPTKGLEPLAGGRLGRAANEEFT